MSAVYCREESLSASCCSSLCFVARSSFVATWTDGFLKLVASKGCARTFSSFAGAALSLHWCLHVATPQSLHWSWRPPWRAWKVVHWGSEALGGLRFPFIFCWVQNSKCLQKLVVPYINIMSPVFLLPPDVLAWHPLLVRFRTFKYCRLN